MWPFTRRPSYPDGLPAIRDDSQSWGLAQGQIGGEEVILRYNETAKTWANHPELPLKLGFAIPLNSPNPGGLPDPEENEQLNDVEDIIVSELMSHTKGIQALAITNGKMKEFVFYIPTGADIKTIHETLQQSITTHEVQCIALMEPKWDTFWEFSPE